ncbi:arginine--tRNA ligase [Niveispirillum irakense]|uniref:arginine--tRNA ligase n=1 Tax=Niveispirillum irakense TaxID=34011 RepID=UPI000419808C|nr:arginine--tRNA ligase [Niveispirillum irakense]
MNVFKDFEAKILTALEQMVAAGDLPAGLDFARITVEPPRDPSHGDVSTNAAMILAKPAGKPPRAIADALVARLKGMEAVVDAGVAGPGFVNLRIAPAFWQSRMADILKAGLAYGASTVGQGRRVNVEYVSANPTGPMHVGHTRGAVVGDALARLLDKAGYSVTREYYINDAGAQVDVLARSAYLRYREALGETVTIPEGLYPGDYLKAVGEALKEKDGDRWVNAEEGEWLPYFREFTVARMMEGIRQDLALLGVQHDVFSSEKAVVDAGAVDLALKTLEDQGLIYTGVLEPPKGKKPEDWEPRPQTLFRASQFGDDVDRPLKKSDGSWTYFANDIAYHYDKFRRSGEMLIDVLGADHGGYVKRMQAAVTAITGGKGALDVKICQLVNLLDGGQPVKMSKRAGRFVTLRDIVEEVGAGVVRFIMLTRRNDQSLDFDVVKVTEQSKENPVFYVQYAHARCHSVLRHARTAGIDLSPSFLASADLSRLDSTAELDLIRLMLSFPRMIEAAADAHEPHRVAFYLYDLASAFHGLWNQGKDDATMRFLIDGDEALTRARLALVTSVALVIAAGLHVLGVEPSEEMR